jgi:hypothetical protein
MADKIAIEIDLKQAKKLVASQNFDAETSIVASTPEGEVAAIVGTLSVIVAVISKQCNDISWDTLDFDLRDPVTMEIVATIKNSTGFLPAVPPMGKKQKIKFNELGPVISGFGRGFDENNDEIWVEFITEFKDNVKCDNCGMIILDFGWQNIHTAKCYCRNCVEVK